MKKLAKVFVDNKFVSSYTFPEKTPDEEIIDKIKRSTLIEMDCRVRVTVLGKTVKIDRTVPVEIPQDVIKEMLFDKLVDIVIKEIEDEEEEVAITQEDLEKVTEKENEDKFRKFFVDIFKF